MLQRNSMSAHIRRGGLKSIMSVSIQVRTMLCVESKSTGSAAADAKLQRACTMTWAGPPSRVERQQLIYEALSLVLFPADMTKRASPPVSCAHTRAFSQPCRKAHVEYTSSIRYCVIASVPYSPAFRQRWQRQFRAGRNATKIMRGACPVKLIAGTWL